MALTLQDYDSIIADRLDPRHNIPNQEQKIPFVIDPRITLPSSLNNIKDILDKLGTDPYDITSDTDDEFTVHFSGGDITYCIFNGYDWYMPNRIVLYGIQTEWSRQALNTEKFNTEVVMYPIQKSDSTEEDINLLSIENNGRYATLGVYVFRGENEVPNDWWINSNTEKRG